MVAEGYAAVTTRRVAGMVGLTPALVHYHYETTEDLLIATYRRAIGRHDQSVRDALARDRPLHALWSLVSDPSRMALGVEFMAMANHRKLIRTEICRHSEEERKLHAEALNDYLASGQSDLSDCSPDCLAMILSGVTRGLVMDEILGVSYGHAETRALVERLLSQLERARRRTRRTRSRR